MISVQIESHENINEFEALSTTIVGITPFQKLMDDDLDDIIFDSNCGFAEDITYKHVTGEQRTYTVLVDTPYHTANIGTPVDVITTSMIIRMQESKLARYPSNGDVITVRGITYTPTSPEPDGVGTINIKLEKVGGFE